MAVDQPSQELLDQAAAKMAEQQEAQTPPPDSATVQQQQAIDEFLSTIATPREPTQAEAPAEMTPEELEKANEYIAKRLNGIEVPPEEVPAAFRPEVVPEMTEEEKAKFDAAFQKLGEEFDRVARDEATREEKTRTLTEPELKEYEYWEEENARREKEKEGKDASLMNIIKLYPMHLEDGVDKDGNAFSAGDVSGPPSMENMRIIQEQLQQQAQFFAQTHETFADLPADNSNNLIGYAQARQMQEEAEALSKQAGEYIGFQEALKKAAEQMGTGIPGTPDKPMTAEEYTQFRQQYADFQTKQASAGTPIDPAQVSALPEKIPEPPSRDQVYDLQYDKDNGRIPKPRGESIADKSPGERGMTVREAFDSNNPFVDALAYSERSAKSDPGREEQRKGEKPAAFEARKEAMKEGHEADKGKLKEKVEKGFRELAEKAYAEAGGPDNPDYKERFVEGFMKSHKPFIDSMSDDRLPPAARERRLADMALLLEHPEVVTDNIKGNWQTGEKLKKLSDEAYDIRQEDGTYKKVYKSDPASMASSLSTEIIIDIDAVRSRVDHLATMNGQNYHDSHAAGSDAVSKMIKDGANPELKEPEKLRETIIAENREKFPRKPDESQNPHFDRTSRAADYLLLADQLNLSNVPITMEGMKKEHNHTLRHMSMMEEVMLKNPKTNMLSEGARATKVEEEAEKRMKIASDRQIANAEQSLANTFGPDGADAMKAHLKGQEPAKLMDGDTIASSVKRVDYARETYSVAAAINSDDSLRTIARVAMNDNSPEAAMKLVKDAQALKKPEDRQKMAETMLAKSMDTDKDGKISETEALIASAQRYFKKEQLDTDKDGKISGAEAQTALIEKFDKNKDGKLAYDEQKDAAKMLGGDNSILANVLKVNGMDLAAIAKKISGGQDVVIAASGGTVGEGVNAQTVGAKQNAGKGAAFGQSA